MSLRLIEIEKQVYDHRHEIDAWLAEQAPEKSLPLYSSIDVRDSGFKVSGIDTNLFPAGFNNLCSISSDKTIKSFQKAVLERVPQGKHLLIIPEEHTRNTWYLENVWVLQDVAIKAGFKTTVATFLDEAPKECDDKGYIKALTATEKELTIYCLKQILEKYENKTHPIDMIILNNDLLSGIPTILRDSNIPIFPALHAGWHSRTKSHHFKHSNQIFNKLMQSFRLDIEDPWFFSTIFSKVNNINVNSEVDRQKLADHASDLFKAIGKKHAEHGIDEKPFIFLKADAGTYGMGVLPIESPDELLQLNRKARNKLAKGKSAIPITNYILQEGISSVNLVNDKPGEVVIYQIGGEFVGSFFRSHHNKTSRENLNAPGMTFTRICNDTTPATTEVPIGNDFSLYHEGGMLVPPTRFYLYKLLAKVAAIAAYEELEELDPAKALLT